MNDLFGHTPQQAGLFEEPLPPAEKRIEHTPETIRARMLAIIAAARAAETMPFTPRELQSHTGLFPFMAEWLPKDEGDQLVLEFEAEIERLKRAA